MGGGWVSGCSVLGLFLAEQLDQVRPGVPGDVMLESPWGEGQLELVWSRGVLG